MTEEQDFSDIERVFLPLLREQERDENLIIVDAIEMPGSNPGDNYMSIVIRTKMTGILGNGIPFEKSFITKRFPSNRQLVSFARTAELFRNEGYVYQTLLPLIGPFGPKCIYADPETIILDDLCAKGFSICERRSLLDLNHCVSVIQTLASFHAMSLSFKLFDPEHFQRLMQPMAEIVFPPDSRPSVGQSINNGIVNAIRSLETIQPPTQETRRSIEFLKTYIDNAYTITRELISTHGKHHVLTHGDIWSNNILFSPLARGKFLVRLVDFQAVRHASPATDFLYFVYSSARSSVIEQSYGYLVNLYHSSLLHDLRFLRVSEAHCQSLTIEWFQSELQRYALFGLFSALTLVHAILASPISVAVGTTENIQALVTNVPITPEKTERIEYIVSHFIRTYR